MGLNTKLLFFLPINAFLAVFGYVFIISDVYLSEALSVIYSGIAAIIALVTSYSAGKTFRNWTLWLFGFYFLLYPFSALIGLLIYGPSISTLDYATTFANYTTASSRQLSFLLTGFAISTLAVMVSLFPPSKVVLTQSKNIFLERFGLGLFLVSFPMVLWHHMWSFIFLAEANLQYAFIYSAEFQDMSSPVPLISVWTNLNWMGFLLFLSSVPSRRSFFWVALLYLIISLAASLIGSRILFLVPLALVIWFRAHLFPDDNLRIWKAFSTFLLRNTV